MRLARTTLVAAATLAAACACALPARAGTCGLGMYAYAGYGTDAAAAGVSATIAQTSAPNVRDGHVAGWVGVSDPNGNGWIQIGLSAFPGQATSGIYVEVARPGGSPVYRQLAAAVAPDQPHRVAVLELRRHPGSWRVWLDGRPVTAPLVMPRSHGRWDAQALGESWAGRSSGSCNLYGYSFAHVSVRGAHGGPVAATPVHDADYVLVRRSRTSFVAASAAPIVRFGAAASTASP